MNTKDKMNSISLIKAFAMIFIGHLLFVSCLKDNTSNLENDSKLKYQKLLTDYGMTQADSIGYGVYMKFDKLSGDTAKPASTDFALISYTGYYSDGSFIETSDSATAKQLNKYYNDIVYGPTKVTIANTLPGIYLALLNMPLHSSANIVIPSEMAYRDYEPVIYKLKLHDIIKDEVKYETDQFWAYRAGIGFSGKFNSDSTIEYRIESSGTEASVLSYNSKVTISLHGYYVEWIDSLLNKSPGRQFFPISGSSDQVIFYYQYSVGFPLTAAIDSMLPKMKINDVCEFITTSKNTYGENGYLNPNFNLYIVPRYTSLHYKMKLLNVE
jgi:FKBP-type peptidyl-prolyl cis-trans isomerase 2